MSITRPRARLVCSPLSSPDHAPGRPHLVEPGAPGCSQDAGWTGHTAPNLGGMAGQKAPELPSHYRTHERVSQSHIQCDPGHASQKHTRPGPILSQHPACRQGCELSTLWHTHSCSCLATRIQRTLSMTAPSAPSSLTERRGAGRVPLAENTPWSASVWAFLSTRAAGCRRTPDLISNPHPGSCSAVQTQPSLHR